MSTIGPSIPVGFPSGLVISPSHVCYLHDVISHDRMKPSQVLPKANWWCRASLGFQFFNVWGKSIFPGLTDDSEGKKHLMLKCPQTEFNLQNCGVRRELTDMRWPLTGVPWLGQRRAQDGYQSCAMRSTHANHAQDGPCLVPNCMGGA